ncbi:MAG: PD-(D/E)XK motif protein [Acidobacteria bacterium]|nr:PD-(D/E)XK motif protein [Acidobacteriota bacterium]
MTKLNENPWAQMPPSSKRRIEEWSERDLFWITDLKGAYGFHIRSSTPFRENSTRLRLKGIVIGKNVTDEGADFYLVLQRNDDWQIFKVLCLDLISAAVNAPTDRSMIAAIETRLRRWQQLLKSDLQKQLSIETQMGLFSELLCMRDVMAPRLGLGEAVKKWGGPTADKQDFVCDSSAVEVKSYLSSKGPTVIVSSVQQLWTDKDRLYLAVYGLSPSDAGATIEDIFTELTTLLNGNLDAKELFETKVGQYGFAPEFNAGELTKFIADGQRFYSVFEPFPRINPTFVAGEITSVKYTIDLSRCSRFEIQEGDLHI